MKAKRMVIAVAAALALAAAFALAGCVLAEQAEVAAQPDGGSALAPTRWKFWDDKD